MGVGRAGIGRLHAAWRHAELIHRITPPDKLVDEETDDYEHEGFDETMEARENSFSECPGMLCKLPIGQVSTSAGRLVTSTRRSPLTLPMRPYWQHK